MAEDGGPIKAQPKKQFKVILRVTGLLLSCAVLFLSGFYRGLYQGEITQTPEAGVTVTYPPNYPNPSDPAYASDNVSNEQPGVQVVGTLAGTVSKVEVDPLLGTVVTIPHQGGLETSYGRNWPD